MILGKRVGSYLHPMPVLFRTLIRMLLFDFEHCRLISGSSMPSDFERYRLIPNASVGGHRRIPEAIFRIRRICPILDTIVQVRTQSSRWASAPVRFRTLLIPGYDFPRNPSTYFSDKNEVGDIFKMLLFSVFYC